MSFRLQAAHLGRSPVHCGGCECGKVGLGGAEDTGRGANLCLALLAGGAGDLDLLTLWILWAIRGEGRGGRRLYRAWEEWRKLCGRLRGIHEGEDGGWKGRDLKEEIVR